MSRLIPLDESNTQLIIIMYIFQVLQVTATALFFPNFWSWEESRIVSWVIIITVNFAYHKRPIIENLLLTISPWASSLLVSLITIGAGYEFIYSLGEDTIDLSIIYVVFSLIFGIFGFILGRGIREVKDYIYTKTE